MKRELAAIITLAAVVGGLWIGIALNHKDTPQEASHAATYEPVAPDLHEPVPSSGPPTAVQPNLPVTESPAEPSLEETAQKALGQNTRLDDVKEYFTPRCAAVFVAFSKEANPVLPAQQITDVNETTGTVTATSDDGSHVTLPWIKQDGEWKADCNIETILSSATLEVNGG